MFVIPADTYTHEDREIASRDFRMTSPNTHTEHRGTQDQGTVTARRGTVHPPGAHWPSARSRPGRTPWDGSPCDRRSRRDDLECIEKV